MQTFARVFGLAIFLATCVTAATPAQDTGQTESQTETEMGRDTFQELKDQGVVVSSSPLYDVLRPIERAIAPVVQDQYNYPLHFYIVHDKSPNAFATPGGNVYVVDSLFYFVHNREELAGTLCHETSHLIYHDSINEYEHDQVIRRRKIVAEVLLGPSIGTILAASVLGHLDSLHFSRDVEERADLKGADTCAAAGLNPWGLVWLMKDFENSNLDAPPEVLSDHPDDAHRIQRLLEHFNQDPSRFGRFNTNRKNATPLRLPKNPQETFLK